MLSTSHSHPRGGGRDAPSNFRLREGPGRKVGRGIHVFSLIFDVQFKLTLCVSETSLSVFLLAYLNETDTLDLFD